MAFSVTLAAPLAMDLAQEGPEQKQSVELLEGLGYERVAHSRYACGSVDVHVYDGEDSGLVVRPEGAVLTFEQWGLLRMKLQGE